MNLKKIISDLALYDQISLERENHNLGRAKDNANLLLARPKGWSGG